MEAGAGLFVRFVVICGADQVLDRSSFQAVFDRALLGLTTRIEEWGGLELALDGDPFRE
jgi:hypothetical protein